MSCLVTMGEILLRWTLPAGRRWEQSFPGNIEASFGGSEATVAATFASLGGRARFVTSLPENPLTETIWSSLRGMDLDLSGSLRRSVGRVGQYFLEPGTVARASEVLYDRENSAFAITDAGDYDWDAVFADADCLMLSAISPALSRTAWEVCQVAMCEARDRGVPVAFDLNFRRQLWNWSNDERPIELARRLLPGLVSQSAILFCGEPEMVDLLGVSDSSGIGERFPELKHVISPIREGASYSATAYDLSGKQAYRPAVGPLFLSEVIDRLGTGDAFGGAWLSAYLTGRSSQEALNFATAAGYLAHYTFGDFARLRRSEIETLLSSGGESQAGRVHR